MTILRNNFAVLQQYHRYLKARTNCSGATFEIYETYNRQILDWAAEQPLSNAPSFIVTFPKYLINHRNSKNEHYSAEYMQGICSYTRRFFTWAYDNKEEYQKITRDWISTIKPEKTIDGIHEIVFYSLDEVQRICDLKPESMRLKRAIAALAFLLLSGMRIAAFFTLPIRNVNLDAYTVRQLPSEGVCTKYNKAAITTLLVNSKLMKIIKEWDNLVRSQCPPDSSWYARLNNEGKFNPRIIIPMTIDNKDELKKRPDILTKIFARI